jgi:exodeoxyribonuclease III
MKVATFNANSVRARLGIILDWLAREQPDLLGLQETKVQDRDFPAEAFREAGYYAAFRGQKSYNGVAVLSRRPVEQVRVDLGDPGPDQEARYIRMEIGALRFVNVYVPQGHAVGSDKFRRKLEWLRAFLEDLRTGSDPGRPLLVTGDFNVALDARDVYDPEGLEGQVCFHPEERALLGEILDWGLVDVFRAHQPGPGLYTFWDYRVPNGVKRNIGWRIDYILATSPLAGACTGAWIDPAPRSLEKPSDHTFLVAEFQYPI